MDCPLLVCVENTCLSLDILKIGPTSQPPPPPPPLLSSLPLLLSKTRKSPQKKSKKKLKIKNLFSTLHSQPHIIYHIGIYLLPSRNVAQNPLHFQFSTMHKCHCHAKKKSKTCSVTYLTTRVKKLHLHASRGNGLPCLGISTLDYFFEKLHVYLLILLST